MRVVVVGGVAGGMSAAARSRRSLPDAEVVVLERDQYVSYANCGLPYHVGGVIADRRKLVLETPERLAARLGLDVRVRHEATAIDPAARRVSVRPLDGTTGGGPDAATTTAGAGAGGLEYTLDYDYQVLSPGAAPIVPDMPGIGRALTLRTVGDADAITALIERDRPRTAAVVGGGFVGVEAAENLRHRGLEVTLVELAPQVLAPLDAEMVAPVHDQLRANGVDLALGVGLGKVLPEAVELADGRVVPADLVILAIGVRAETSLARAAGLEIGPRGGIAVDASMRTSDPSIFAVGDAVEKPDHLGGTSPIPLANTANRQGRLVADAIAGRPVRLGPRVGTAVVRVFDLTVAVVGANERRLRAAGRPYAAIHTHPAHHAGYYPGAREMALKLLYDPSDGTVLGAQAVGVDGVDKRIDVIATAMRGGLVAEDLADLELAYAPPYGSAKDPVNMLGYVADNRRLGGVATVQWHELADRVAAGAHVIDVRTPAEYAGGHVPGAVSIPFDELTARRDELPAGDLIVCCQAGQRAHSAAAILAGDGFEVANLDGGYLTWLAGQR